MTRADAAGGGVGAGRGQSRKGFVRAAFITCFTAPTKR